jgi:transposase
LEAPAAGWEAQGKARFFTSVLRPLRQLLRHRLSLLQQRNEVHDQIRDLFETASLKLSSVAGDLLGVSGRRIIEAMIGGEDSPELPSWKLRGSLRKKEKLVRESLKGVL